MPERNEYYDYLFAYSLGCLDEEDLNKLEEYLKTGGDFAWQELGEFQNLASLLPSILNLETPPPQLKDKVARNLYKIRNEKRVKNTSVNASDNTPHESGQSESLHANEIKASDLFKTKTEYTEEDAVEKEAESKEKSQGEETSDESSIDESRFRLNTRTDGFEVVSTQKPSSKLYRPSQVTQIHGRDLRSIIKDNISASENTAEEESQLQEEQLEEGEEGQPIEGISENIKPEEKKKTYTLHGDFGNGSKIEKEKKKFSGTMIGLLLIIIVVSGILYFYYKFSSEVKNYKANVENLNSRIQKLSSNISTNEALENLLQSKNVRIINLQGTKINPTVYGKLIISFDNSTGFLQFSNMPALAEGKAYQLWISIKGKYSSLGVFTKENRSTYYSFKLPEITSQDGAKFIVTQETSQGAENPSQVIFLTGDL